MNMAVAEKKEYIDRKVLIKEAGAGYHDRVFIVKGLPRDLLFGENGKLLPGIQKSATGDGSFVFDTMRESRERLAIIDQYIASVYPNNLPIPKRIYNADQVGESRSGPLTVMQLEERYMQKFRVAYVDLPIPEGNPLYKAPTPMESISSTYRANGFLSSDESPSNERKSVPSELLCAQCDYTAENKKALTMHITVKHGRRKADTEPKEG